MELSDQRAFRGGSALTLGSAIDLIALLCDVDERILRSDKQQEFYSQEKNKPCKLVKGRKVEEVTQDNLFKVAMYVQLSLSWSLPAFIT